MSHDSVLIALIWVLWLAIAAQFILATRAFLLERREGMRISTARLCVIAVTFLVSCLMAASATFVPRQTASPNARTTSSPASTASPKSSAFDKQQLSGFDKQQLSDLEKQLVQVQADLGKLRDQEQPLIKKSDHLEEQIRAISGSKPPPVTKKPPPVVRWEGVDSRTRDVLVFTVLAALLIVGFVLLAVGGPILSLFPNGLNLLGGQNETETSQQVDQFAVLVSQEKYQEALDYGVTIHEKRLRHLDRLDFLFLRGFSAVQLCLRPKPEHTSENRRKMLAAATGDLEEVLAEAPKRAEAQYALAYAYSIAREDGKALAAFESSREILKSEKTLAFHHNESVCLLRLAEKSLTEGKTDEAQGYFDRVAKLGQLGSSVVHSRIRIGMNDLRSAVNRQDLTAASAAIERLAELPNLGATERAQIDVITAALNARFHLRRDSAQLAYDETVRFLSKYLPAGLPPLDDDAADEPFSPVLDDDLLYPREVFHGFLFIQAVALSRIESKGHSAPSEQQVARLAAPLLRALQLVPRQRDVLGALGGLYYWFRRETRNRARDWLDASVSMGAAGRIPRAILERDRLVEMGRRQALDWFRSTSSRFLRDPALASEVRQALFEELGRFQEFEPMLINLREKPDIDQEEPTLPGIRERANYLADLLTRMSRRGSSDQTSRLEQIHAEYSACLFGLEQTAQTLSTLERRVFAELAQNLAMS